MLYWKHKIVLAMSKQQHLWKVKSTDKKNVYTVWWTFEQPFLLQGWMLIKPFTKLEDMCYFLLLQDIELIYVFSLF